MWNLIRLLPALLLPYLLSAQGSGQPQFRAPWVGTKRITQGNWGGTSHNLCGARVIDRHNCRWENRFALDIALNFEPVLAAADGVVTFATDSIASSGGRQMAITHTGADGRAYTTVYLHLSEIRVRSGPVTQGQVIAISGRSSGGSETGTIAHLHFHLWSGSGSFDSQTQPIEALLLKRPSESGYRVFDARRGDLNHSSIADQSFEANADCRSGNTSSSTGDNLIFPSGSLLKLPNDPTVFLLHGVSPQVRYAVSSLNALRNPFNQSSSGDQLVQAQIVTVSAAQLNRYPLAGVLSSPRQFASNGQPRPDGHLISAPSGGEISFFSNGQRRPFTSSAAFNSLGQAFCNVLLDESYSSYPLGTPITTTASTPVVVADSANVVKNGGFERGLEDWLSLDVLRSPPPSTSSTNPQAGNLSLCFGVSPGASASRGLSGVYQWLKLPPDPVNLVFSSRGWSNHSGNTENLQHLLLFDENGSFIDSPFSTTDRDNVWRQREVNLAPHAAKSIAIMFIVGQAGDGSATGMCVDSVSTRIAQSTPSAPRNPALAIEFQPTSVPRSPDGRWRYVLTLRETAGVAAILTGMTIEDEDYSDKISTWFGTNRLSPNGQVSVELVTGGNPRPLLWRFSTASGSWSTTLTLLP